MSRRRKRAARARALAWSRARRAEGLAPLHVFVPLALRAAILETARKHHAPRAVVVEAVLTSGFRGLTPSTVEWHARQRIERKVSTGEHGSVPLAR